MQGFVCATESCLRDIYAHLEVHSHTISVLIYVSISQLAYYEEIAYMCVESLSRKQGAILYTHLQETLNFLLILKVI